MQFKKLRPLLNRVVVKKPEIAKKTKGGIILPESTKNALNYATVLEVGPGKRLPNGELQPCDFKVGDVVLLPEYGGFKVELEEGQELFVYRDDDILGTLHDPSK